MRHALVTGGNSGLGAAIMRRLEGTAEFASVESFDIADGKDVRAPMRFQLPLAVDTLVNCAGINRIGWLENFEHTDWNAVMDTNAKGIFMMVRACLPQLRESVRERGHAVVLNIVSNASHMPMRCSAAYNASKAAAAMLTKQMARELAGEGITVFSVSPNKLTGTGMSRDIDEQVMATRGWTREEMEAYQRASLLTGEETEPDDVAEFCAFLLAYPHRFRALAGCDMPYGL